MRNAGPTVYKMGITKAMRRHFGSPGQVDAPPHHILPSPTNASSELPLCHVFSLGPGSAGGRQLREELFLGATGVSLGSRRKGSGRDGENGASSSLWGVGCGAEWRMCSCGSASQRFQCGSAREHSAVHSM